jgi:hypothetical protein
MLLLLWLLLLLLLWLLPLLLLWMLVGLLLIVAAGPDDSANTPAASTVSRFNANMEGPLNPAAAAAAAVAVAVSGAVCTPCMTSSTCNMLVPLLLSQASQF